MKIKQESIAQITIEEFAKQHGLVMRVVERPLPLGDPARYYAHFEHSDIARNGCLIGVSGDGATPERAIELYAEKITLQTLVINGNRSDMKRFKVPRLVTMGKRGRSTFVKPRTS